jgi:PQQ-like domain
MNISRKKANITAICILIFLIASTAIFTSQTKAAGVTAGNPQGIIVSGTTGPLPSGVTPDGTAATTSYLSVSPYTLGITQPILVNMWIQPPPNAVRSLKDYTVTFTKPDKTTEIIGPLNSYPADSTAWFTYVPDQIGNWSAVFTFPGQYLPAGFYLAGVLVAYPNGTRLSGAPATGGTNLTSTYYQPSTSKTINFVVQADLVASWPPTPLPTSYWARPISVNFREWFQIAGSYPWGYANNYRFQGPYVTAPNTAHVIWRRAGELGGIVGGDIAEGGGGGVQTSIYSGGGFGMDTNFPSIIFMGRCYQTITKPMPQLVNGSIVVLPTSVWQCYDLRTGQIYWEQTGITQAPTRIMWEAATPEVVGAESDWRSAPALVYIGASRLIKYNPFTGAASTNISTPFTGTVWGNEKVYSVQTTGVTNDPYRLVTWNLTGSSTDFSTRIIGNVSYPFGSLGTCDFNTGISVTTGTVSTAGTQISRYLMGVDLTTGRLLWNVTSSLTYFEDAMADNGMYAASTQTQRQWAAWDLKTGKQAWVSEQTGDPWGCFWSYSAESGYGMIYTQTYNGVYAINWTTGKIVWHFIAPTPFAFETPYTTDGVNQYSFFGSAGVSVGDGKIFVFGNEHTPSQPMTRGWKMYAVNATTGTNMWNITGYMTPGAFADGYLTAGSGYDGFTYVFGPSQSATTVTAPQTETAAGTSVLIQGTVMDQSPGTLPSTTSPAGTASQAEPKLACVSEDSMGAYMEYVYMQMPIPSNFTVTGVPVNLIATDGNGNRINIGTATSDMTGTFQYAWTPPTAGLYKITATFAGTPAYGSSYATTGLTVGSAAIVPTPTATTTPISLDAINNNVTSTVIGGVIAIIIAIAIVGLLMLRKRP